ncbi:MAG: hypothetical protein DYG89_00830 [Caldilinea sp. CFX5]|nr:hypothetical protein [Caldilinea sp. CFX5]
MKPANAQRTLQLQPTAQTSNQVAGPLAFVENPRDTVRGFSYWGYFYFTFTNPSPFNAERTVMPG